MNNKEEKLDKKMGLTVVLPQPDLGKNFGQEKRQRISPS